MTYGPVFETKYTIGLLIDPLDVLFFRDGRPFESATKGYGGLPLPQTLMGMIMHHVREHAGLTPGEIHRLRKNNGNEKRWAAWVAVRGPWFVKANGDEVSNIFLPPPAHLVREKSEKSLHLLRPFKNRELLHGWIPKSRDGDELHPLLSDANGKQMEQEHKWLTSSGLEKILNGEVPGGEGDLIDASHVYQWEERTGIGIKPETGTADEEKGLIYGTRLLRLNKDRMLYAEVGIEPGDGVNLDDAFKKLEAAFSGEHMTLKFGGEARRVHLRKVNAYPWPKAPAVPGHNEGGYTTVLISPAIFTCRDQADSSPWMPPCAAKLVGAAVGKPLAVSGWTPHPIGSNNGSSESKNDDKPEAGPRSTRYAVPAGSVYFWQNGKNSDPNREMPSCYTLGNDPRNRAAGWGVALRGIWKWG